MSSYDETFDKKRNSYLEQILELTNKIDSLSNSTSDDNNQERIINKKIIYYQNLVVKSNSYHHLIVNYLMNLSYMDV